MWKYISPVASYFQPTVDIFHHFCHQNRSNSVDYGTKKLSEQEKLPKNRCISSNTMWVMVLQYETQRNRVVFWYITKNTGHFGTSDAVPKSGNPSRAPKSCLITWCLTRSIFSLPPLHGLSIWIPCYSSCHIIGLQPTQIASQHHDLLVLLPWWRTSWWHQRLLVIPSPSTNITNITNISYHYTSLIGKPIRKSTDKYMCFNFVDLSIENWCLLALIHLKKVYMLQLPPSDAGQSTNRMTWRANGIDCSRI